MTEQIDEIDAIMSSGDIGISGEGLTPVSRDEDVRKVETDIVKSKMNYELSFGDITTAFRAGRRPCYLAPDKRPIRVRISRPDLARDILNAARTVKPQHLFVNEWLTPTRSRFLATLRQAKRQFPQSIAACGSQSGRVYVWVKPPNGDGRNVKTIIDSERKLDEFCSKSFNLKACELLAQRPQQH